MGASSLQNQSSDITLSSMGAKGGIVLTDTTAITGEFRAIYALTDCTFTTLTMPEFTTNGIVTASVGADFGTLTAGSSLLGKISACTLATGSAILYK